MTTTKTKLKIFDIERQIKVMLIETVIKQIHVNLKSSATTVAITTTKSQILQIQTPQNYSLARVTISNSIILDL